MEEIVKNDVNFDINLYYTIKEVADMLEINQMTVRRRIKKGELQAIKHMGIYNQEQYFLPKAQFDHAEQVIDVLEVKKTYDLQQFSLSLNSFLEDRENKIKDQLQSDINKSKVEVLEAVQGITDHIDALKTQNEAILEQNRILNEQVEVLKAANEAKEEEPKGFFSKLFK